MPSVQFAIIHSRLSLGEYRRHLPTANTLAALLNALGGKGDGEGKAMPEHKRFDPHELLPSYARPEALYRGLPLTPAQCVAVMDAIADRELPSWAVQHLGAVMPLAQIMRLGGTRSGEADGERDGFERLLAQEPER